MALNGSLDDYSPAGALRVLSSTGRTGAVRFTGSAGCTAYLCEGQLYFARGEETDDALAAALVRPGRLSPEAWTEAVEDAGDSPRVGELLISSGAIDPDLLASVVLSVIYDPLITLFREGDGQFDFEADTMHWIGPYRGFNVEAIVNEVRRRVRNVDEMSDVVPSTNAWVSASRTLPDGAAQVTLLREDWELVTALSGPRTVRELAGAMGRGQYSTAQVVHRLARAGLLEVVPEPFSPVGDDPVHEPSAAERIAAAEAASQIEVIATDDDAPEETGTDHPVADASAPDDETVPTGSPFETEATATDWQGGWDVPGNPFEHDPRDDEVEVEVGLTFGSLAGAALGPEVAPDDDAQMLPRRSSVREADPSERWNVGDVEVREPVASAAEALSSPAPTAEAAVADVAEPAGIAGIVGFVDPMAEVHRENTALAQATSAPEQDPNAAWLENLYAQFIDEPGEPQGSRSRKKEALDVAFQAEDQSEGERTGTLRRLVDALRRI